MRRFADFLLILLLIAVVLRVEFFFTVVYFLAAVWILSRLWARRAPQQLRGRRRFAKRAFTGDEVEVALTVRNEGWLPVPWLELNETAPVHLLAAPLGRQVIGLGPREEWRFAYTLVCRQRGYYTIGPLTLQTGDLLGIARESLTLGGPEGLLVYPRIVPLYRLGLPTRSPLAVLPARSPLFEDPSRIIGVRGYRRGDSPRRMHWPATARTGRLMVKQYQPAIARETLLCLDLDEASYTREDRRHATELAIVVAASLANHIIIREGLPVGLATEAWDPLTEGRRRFALPPRAERAGLTQLLEVLARVQVTPEAPLAPLLRRESLNLAWGATVTVITGRASAELLDATLALERGGFAPTLIVVGPGGPADEPSSLGGVRIHRVWRDEELEVLQ